MKKRILQYWVGGLLLISMSGCDFLNVDPVGRTTVPLLFSDMEGIRSALPGAYAKVYNFYDSELLKYPEVAGNMLHLNTVSENTNMVSQYNYNSNPDDETMAVGYIWRYGYEALGNINNIIEYQPGLVQKFSGNKYELNRIMAEALFLRALVHFDLCRVYAQSYKFTSDASHPGIPIVLKTPAADDNLPRSTVKQVYEQIIADLGSSLEYFEGTEAREDYYASPNAVDALLSRVYLYMEEWDMVISNATSIIDLFPLSQGNDYLGMYNNLEAGDENIFRLNGTLKSSSLSSFYASSLPIASPEDTLIGLFGGTDDLRLQLLTDENGGAICRKYLITAAVSEQNKHYDPFILRSSEMYLNRAEAYLNKDMLAEAAADVKAIIARGLQVDVSEVEINETDKGMLAQTIEEERAKELCFEGHQLYDITRKKQDLVRSASTNSSIHHIEYPSDYFVLPIPQKEMDTNPNMQQNPSYN